MPKKYLDLDTDSNFTANSDYYVPSQKAIKTALDNKADTDSVPTKTSDLDNDSNYVASTNLKTINNTSIVGTGNIDVDGLPDQTSQSGKILTTNGMNASWTDKTEVIFRQW